MYISIYNVYVNFVIFVYNKDMVYVYLIFVYNEFTYYVYVIFFECIQL